MSGLNLSPAACEMVGISADIALFIFAVVLIATIVLFIPGWKAAKNVADRL